MKSTIQNKSADYLDLWTCSEFCKLISFHKSLIWGHFGPIFFLLKYLGPILVHFEWAVYMEPNKGLSPICFLLPSCFWGVCMSVMLYNRFSGMVFGSLWITLDQFRSLWINLDQFGYFWINLGPFLCLKRPGAKKATRERPG